MSDAVEFSIGGNNKGFVAVLNDSEQKAKQSADKIIKEEERKRRAEEKAAESRRRELNGLAGDFARVTSVSQAFELALSKVGGGLKAAGAVAIVTALGKGIYDAFEKASELDLAMQRIGRSSLGGVANFGIDKLKADLSQIQEARAASEEGVKDWLSTYGTITQDTLARIGNSTIGAATGTQISVMSPSERTEYLRKAELTALARIAEKEREIWDIERARIRGNEELASRFAVQANYRERIQAEYKKQVSAGSQDMSSVDRLKEEEKTVLAALDRESASRIENRARNEIGAALGVRAARLSGSTGMSATDARRLTWEDQIGFAESELRHAKNRAARRPGDPNAASEAIVAEQNLARIVAERAKWERDIARSKGDQETSIEAESKALMLRMQGREKEAQLVERRARSEREALLSSRELGKEMGDQVRKLAKLRENVDLFQEALRDDGSLRGGGERMAGVRKERLYRRRIGRSLNRFNRDNGLLRVRRDSSGNVLSGIDPVTGERVGANGEALGNDPFNTRGGAIDSTVGVFGSGIDLHRRMNDLAPAPIGPPMSPAMVEMRQRSLNASRQLEVREKSISTADAALQSGGPQAAQDILKGIYALLSEWNQGKE